MNGALHMKKWLMGLMGLFCAFAVTVGCTGGGRLELEHERATVQEIEDDMGIDNAEFTAEEGASAYAAAVNAEYGEDTTAVYSLYYLPGFWRVPTRDWIVSSTPPHAAVPPGGCVGFTRLFSLQDDPTWGAPEPP